MPINAVQPAFTGRQITKKGNEYNKTSISTKIGAGAGVVLGGLGIRKCLNYMSFAKMVEQLGSKKLAVSGLALLIGSIMILTTNIGQGVDAIINACRRKKADNAGQS